MFPVSQAKGKRGTGTTHEFSSAKLARNQETQLFSYTYSPRRQHMASQKWLSAVLAVSLFVLWAFTLLSGKSSPSAGNTDDERVIRQLNEECLHAHDIGDAVTLDRIEDADFTLSGDFGVVSKQQQ